jgi:serine/threonine protein kinase/tetratricopeptide (TPR) repeat protein
MTANLDNASDEPLVRRTFLRALELPTPQERQDFLAEACGGNFALRAKVEALLRSHREDSFLERPAEEAIRPSSVPARNDVSEKPGTVIGRYKLLEKIGEGGFGEVWMAEQKEPVKRRVALKILKLGLDTKQVVARFEAERQALAMMDHPNIAKVLDGGATDTGRPYFVMELVPGVRITEYCDQNQLPTRERLGLFIQVCRAIQHAHQKGLIHRDIKPSNILVTSHDGVPVPKVIDFGIAKATQQELTERTVFTEFRQFLGTPAYISPEQAEMSGMDIDTRSDIYSLGVLLYELLTGRTPFDPQELLKASLEQLRQVIREKEPLRPSTKLATLRGEELTTAAKRRSVDMPRLIHLLRGDLDWIVMKCLEKDRTRRYETANGLAMDLRRHLENEPVVARPPSAAYRLQKACRRHKAAFATAALIGAVLVAATGVSAWQAFRATRAEKLAAGRLIESENARMESEAISKFLTEVFQSPDPARDGRTITVAETLGVAARKLDTELAGQPARLAKLQATLALTYHALGLDREAIPLQEKARDYYLAVCGQEHPDTLSTMHNLANSYDEAGRRAEALKLQEQVRALRRKVLGPEHPDTLLAMNSLASFYDEVGRRAEAFKLREEVLALCHKVLGPEHPYTLTAMNNLAASYDEMGRRDEALKLREQVLPLRRKVNGPEHPDTLRALRGLGNSYDLAGRRDEALKLREEALPLCRKILGPENAETLMAMHNLAVSYDEMGRRDEALKLREEVLALRRKVLGPEHPEMLSAMNNLANSYDGTGRREEALKLREEVLARRRKVLGPEHPDTLLAMHNLAGSYAGAGRQEEALKLREEVLALRRKVLGPEHPDTLNAMNALSLSYYGAGRREEALRLKEQVLALRRKVLGPEHRDTLQAMQDLANLYFSVGRSSEATTLLAKACEADPKDTVASLKLATWQTWFGQDADYEATRTRLVQQALGTAQTSTAERAAKAYCLRPSTNAALLAEVLTLAQGAVDLEQSSPDLAWFQLCLGLAEYRNGRYAAAERALTLAEQTAREYQGDIPGTARLYRVMSLFRQDKPEEARKLFTQAAAQMPPLPKDENKPLVDGEPASHDVLICWLACKEARSLLNEPAAAKP